MANSGVIVRGVSAALAGLVLAVVAGAEDAPLVRKPTVEVTAKPAGGPPPIGNVASAAYQKEFFDQAAKILLSPKTNLGGSGKSSAIGAAVKFINQRGEPADQATEADYKAKIDAVVADTELVFVQTKWIALAKEEGKVSIAGGAKGAGLTPALKKKMQGWCQCTIGTDDKKAAILIFNDSGSEKDPKADPAIKLNHTAAHEVLHLVLPKYKGEKLNGDASAKWHHGLTRFLCLGGGLTGNYVSWGYGSCDN